MTNSLTGIKVRLTGVDGNAFSILGHCTRAMRKAKLDESQIDQFRKEAMSGDYDNLIQTCIKWFDVN